MRITTLDEARALIGRTFERDGESRRISGISLHKLGCYAHWSCGNYAFRVNKVDDLDDFLDWLSGATEVTDATRQHS
jgi:hypothetical protein